MLRAGLAALCALLTVGCTSLDGDSRIFVASTPAGADILVDDQPTGKTTPSMLDLEGFFGDDHQITLQLDGYEPETRWVRHHVHYGFSRRGDGAEEKVLGFVWFLWWTLEDFFVPFKATWAYAPHEVHATLYREGEAPVRTDDP